MGDESPLERTLLWSTLLRDHQPAKLEDRVEHKPR